METIYQFKQTDFDKFLGDLKKHITEELKSIQPVKSDKKLSIKETAGYLKISIKTYYVWVSDGTIPKNIIHRKGSRVFFFESELEALIKKS